MTLREMWRLGGFVLSLAFVAMFVAGGARHGIGLVLKPMAESLDWDRTALGAVIAVFMACNAVTMVVVGRLADRHPPGLILAGGFLVSAIGVGAMTVVENAWQAFLLYGVVFAVGNGAVSITPVGVMLTRRFGAAAGRANAIAIAGMGLGQLAILSGLAAVLVDAGWRDVFFWLGAINLAVAPVLLLGARRERAAAASAPPARAEGLSVRECARRRSFWALMIAYAICGCQDFFVSSHVVAFGLDQGMDALLAGNLLAFMGLAGLIGVLAAGAWSDRSGPVQPTMACFLIRIAIFGLVAITWHPIAIAVFALAYGVTFWVTAPLTVIFVRDLYGPKNLGLISGLVTMVHHMAGGVGALVGAMLFDRDGDYQAAFTLMLGMSVIAAIATLGITRRPRQ